MGNSNNMGPSKRPSEADLRLATDAKLPRLDLNLNSTPSTTPLHPLSHPHRPQSQLPIQSQPPLQPQPQQHEQQSSDFSGSVRKKLDQSKRTGQACDRCKIRKIRCDGRPEGCLQCAQNRTTCKTTDRITGRATTRGHTEATEAQNSRLRSHIADLESQLKDLGVEPRAAPAYIPSDDNTTASSRPNTSAWPSHPEPEALPWQDGSSHTSSSPRPGHAPAHLLDNAEHKALPDFKQSSVGDNYLGVSPPDLLISHIRGTSLSVFGTDIDITDFVENKNDYDTSPYSYTHFLSVAFDGEPVEKAELPTYRSLSDYATWYLRSMNPYTMLVDKRTMMNLIWRIGNEPNFAPSIPEKVCVHMLLATLEYQISKRNGEDFMMQESHRHFRYALHHVRDLLRDHTWQAVQALTMICHHLRNFPKPGAAWIMCSTTFCHAIELGLHRSTKAWADSNKMDKTEIEMRKRIFWGLHALHVNLSGKLGRPMPVHMDDIDVEFPEAVHDYVSTEDPNMPEFQKCSFRVGIEIAKYTAHSNELFRTIYTVSGPSHNYEATVRKIEAGIRQWKQELPQELRDPTQAAETDYIFALYLEHWHQEVLLLLHHPAVCRSTKPEVINSNLDKCLVASRKLLHICKTLRERMSIDIPWINTVVYIAATFTTLFIHDQRKSQMTPADMTQLRDDMDEWLKIIDVCGQLLGSGDRLRAAISNIVENALRGINDSIVKRTAESLAQAALQNSRDPPSTTAPQTFQNGRQQQQQPPAYNPATTNTTQCNTYSNAPANVPYPYTSSTPTPAPLPPSNTPFHQPPYSSVDSQLTPSAHPTSLAPSPSSGSNSQHYPYPTSQLVNHTHDHTHGHDQTQQQHYSPHSSNGISDWRQWAQTYMATSTGPGDPMGTASTLMALGGGSSGNSNSANATTNGTSSASDREGSASVPPSAGPPPPLRSPPDPQPVSGHDAHTHAQGHGPSSIHFAWPSIQFAGASGA